MLKPLRSPAGSFAISTVPGKFSDHFILPMCVSANHGYGENFSTRSFGFILILFCDNAVLTVWFALLNKKDFASIRLKRIPGLVAQNTTGDVQRPKPVPNVEMLSQSTVTGLAKIASELVWGTDRPNGAIHGW